MRKFLVILLLNLFFFTSLKADVAKKIVIEGNSRISEETIKLYGNIQLNRDYKDKDLDIILQELYQTEFFENVNVELFQGTLKVSVKEYPVINQLVIIGEKNNRYKEQIKKIIKLKEKRSLIRSYLSKDIDRIRFLYSSLGYNSSKVDIKVKEIDTNSFDLLIDINRGEQTKIMSIDFIGNDNIKSRRLRDIIASEEDKFWKVLTRNTNLSENLINLDQRLLRNYYKSLGFYDIKVSSNLAQLNKLGNAKLIYTIDEGSRYTINKISTNVDKVYDKDLFFPLNKTFKKYIGNYYSPFSVKKILEELDDLIDLNNLQFAEHNVEEIINGNNISIIFNIFEGEKTLVERINITGNTITNENVIRGELILDEGDPFTELNLQKSISEIKARNIFKKVDYKIQEGSEKNLKIINIEVEERPTGEISAGAGIGTNGGNFAFTVKENNWLGEGKSIAFDIDASADTLAGSISYNDPNYDFLGNSVYYSLSSINNDKPTQGYENSLIVGRASTTFEQYRNVDVLLGLSASYDDLRTENNASASLKKQSGNYNEITGDYGFTLDDRNRSFMPTSGSIISFSQSLPFYADKSFIGNTFVASGYKSFGEDVVGASKLYISSIDGLGDDDVRLSKRLVVSNKRLRGFERGKVGPVDGDDHVGGNHVAAINFEANLPNALPEDTNIDLSLFLDFANVWGVDYDPTINDSNKLRSSTGVMANWMSPIGPMSFVLSQNISKASTDVTESFNFNLGTTF